MMINYEDVKDALKKFKENGGKFDQIESIEIDGIKVTIIKKSLEKK